MRFSNLRISILNFACFSILLCSCWNAGQVTISVNEAGDEVNADSRPVNQKIDILLVMDCSGSMSQEIGSVQKNILSFVERYITKGYDFRVGVIRTGAWAQYLYNAEQARINDPTNLALHIDGTNGIQNDMIPGLNILHSGQSINDPDDDHESTGLTGAPILDLGSITEADREALNINFCSCTYNSSDEIECEDPDLHSCVVFNDPENPDKESWIKQNPDTFLAKFSRNVDVYGLTSGGHYGGFLDPTAEINFDTSARPFHADERGFQAIMAFIEHGDLSVNLSKEMYQKYGEIKDIPTDENGRPLFNAFYPDFWSRFKGTPWAQSGPSNFFRKGAFVAVVMVTDEIEASRTHLDPQTDNGPVDKIADHRKEHYPRILSRYKCILPRT